MKQKYIFYTFFSVILFSFSPNTTHAAIERYSEYIHPTILKATPYEIQWNGVTLRLPKQTLSKTLTVKMRNKGAIETTTLPIPSTDRVQVRSDVYTYHLPTAMQKMPRVRIDFDFSQYGKKKKQILFLPSGGKKWERLPTLMNKKKGYVQALLPKRSGTVIVVTHRFKKESPKKRLTFQSYPGTPYSDKAVVMDVSSGRLLYKEKAYRTQHIASITKLATTEVFLSHDPDLDEMVTYKKEYDRIGATVPVEKGDRFSLEQALYATLMPSANNMAMLLSDSVGLSHADFVSEMNAIAQSLGLEETRFVEPTGLDARNVSSPAEMAKFALHVFSSHPDIFQSAAESSTYTISLQNKKRTHTAVSTNLFDGKGRFRVKAFKTGYYPGTAERTLAIWIEPISGKGEIMIVLFGNPEYGTINDEAYELAAWAFENWNFHNYKR